MQSGFLMPTRQQRVSVSKPWGVKFDGTTTHEIYGVSLNVRGEPVPGELLGVGVTDDRGFAHIAQPDQMVVTGEANGIS